MHWFIYNYFKFFLNFTAVKSMMGSWDIFNTFRLRQRGEANKEWIAALCEKYQNQKDASSKKYPVH